MKQLRAVLLFAVLGLVAWAPPAAAGHRTEPTSLIVIAGSSVTPPALSGTTPPLAPLGAGA